VLSRYQFQPRFVTTLAAAAVFALGLAAAWWQLGRAHEKEAVAARLQAFAGDPPIRITAIEMQARDVEWRRVTARGRFDPGRAVLIDNRTHRGVAGYHVMMPLALDGGDRYVLVNRGWVAGSAVRSELPQITTPAETVSIAGLATVPSQRYFELSTEVAEGKVWQNLTLERYREAFPVPLRLTPLAQRSNQLRFLLPEVSLLAPLRDLLEDPFGIRHGPAPLWRMTGA